ncbi:MAG TPA: hypothetical protein VLJ20_01560, partial [Acetobacteraceae bacterium]|nr:hypothetical protein [Acetobacteraceae bacterium]
RRVSRSDRLPNLAQAIDSMRGRDWIKQSISSEGRRCVRPAISSSAACHRLADHRQRGLLDFAVLAVGDRRHLVPERRRHAARASRGAGLCGSHFTNFMFVSARLQYGDAQRAENPIFLFRSGASQWQNQNGPKPRRTPRSSRAIDKSSAGSTDVDGRISACLTLAGA